MACDISFVARTLQCIVPALQHDAMNLVDRQRSVGRSVVRLEVVLYGNARVIAVCRKLSKTG